MIQGAEEWQNQRPLLSRKPEVAYPTTPPPPLPPSPPHAHISQNHFLLKGLEVVSQTLLPDWLAWFFWGGGGRNQKTDENKKNQKENIKLWLRSLVPQVPVWRTNSVLDTP